MNFFLLLENWGRTNLVFPFKKLFQIKFQQNLTMGFVKQSISTSKNILSRKSTYKVDTAHVQRHKFDA